jgi:hypothetical protein
VAIRNGTGIDVCDEKHLGCDGMYCVGGELWARGETCDRKSIKVPAISTKSENQLNLLRLSITGTDADFAGMNLAEAVTNG